MNLSLCVITKGEPTLAQCVTSALPAVDEVVLVDTRADRSAPLFDGIEQCPQVRVVAFDWIDDFKAARDFGFSQCSNDYVLWLDSDDTLVGAAKLREFFDAKVEEMKGRPFSVFLRYDYAFDTAGNCLSRQRRERIVPRKLGEWRVPIHESWCPYSNLREADPDVSEVYVVHGYVIDPANMDATFAKQRRNFELMERYIARCIEDGKLPDRRLFFHYCQALVDLGHHKAAVKYLADFVREEPRGWCKCRSYLLMARCYMAVEKWDEVANFAALALIQQPNALMPYVYLHRAAFNEHRWGEAMYWFAQAYERGNRGVDDVCFNPIEAVPNYEAAAFCCIGMGVYDKALGYAKKSGNEKLIAQCVKARKDQLKGDAVVDLLSELPDDKRAPFARLLPESVADHPAVARYRAPELPDDRLTIAIHCGSEGMGGGKADFWGPEDLECGIGGSETMVIRLAPRLVKAGAHVEVYGPWRKDQVVDGVHWRHYSHYDPTRLVQAFIAWRYPDLLELAPEGAFKALWMHDQPHSILDKEADSVAPDEVWALTEDHAANIKARRPDYPVWVTRNGIEDFSDVECTKVPGYVIYASSPDRGLLTLLRWWPDIKAKRPDAQLHCFYGFTKTWHNLEQNQPALKKQRLEIERLVKELPDVHWHGAVGQPELHAEMSKACVWAYPTRWPESSCITAMEMGALGVIPVTNNFSALAETVLPWWGKKFDVENGKQIEDYKDEFVEAVAQYCDIESYEKYRPAMREIYQRNYDLRPLAEQWIEHLKEKCSERRSEPAAVGA